MTLERQLAEAQLKITELSERLELERLELLRLAETMATRDRCWHCYASFEEEDPPNCGSCPEWRGCSEPNCDAPGCQRHPVTVDEQVLANLEDRSLEAYRCFFEARVKEPLCEMDFASIRAFLNWRRRR